MIKGLVLGMLVGVLLIVVSVFFYFSSGRAPVATAAPPMPFEKKLAQLGLHAYLDKLPHPEPQVPADEVNLIAGAKIYKEHCAVCHGLPNEPKTAVARGMYPEPPHRRDGRRCVGIVLEGGEWHSNVGDARIQGLNDGNADLAGDRPGEECGQDHGIGEKGTGGRGEYTDGNGDALEHSGAEEEIDSTRRIKPPSYRVYLFFAIRESTRPTIQSQRVCPDRPRPRRAPRRTIGP
jgi:hypothetical protein